MHRYRHRGFVIAVWLVGAVLVLAGCNANQTEGTPPDLAAEAVSFAAVRTAIDSVNASFMAAISTADAGGAAAVYTADAKIFPPSSDVVSGRDAIAAYWSAGMEGGASTALLETVDLEVHGDTAIEEGRFTLRGDTGQVLDTGKFFVIWKETTDGWRWHRDIWNSSLAAATE